MDMRCLGGKDVVVSESVSAMLVVFIAELGDKTQLVALGFGARFRVSLVVAGLAVGYLASSTLSVVVGALAGAALPTDLISIIGGLLFVAFAVWTYLDRPQEPASDSVSIPDPTSKGTGNRLHVVGTVAVALFVAELGDKTMLATATLAARGNAVAVWIGATIGIFCAGVLGALLGRLLGDRLPERAIRLGASMLFAAFGIALLITAV